MYWFAIPLITLVTESSDFPILHLTLEEIYINKGVYMISPSDT